MRDYLIIKLPADVAGLNPDSEVLCAEYSDDGCRQDSVVLQPLKEISQRWDENGLETLADRIIVLLPGTLAASMVVDVNEGQRKHLRQALPFLVEENLASDVEDFHLANRSLGASRVGVNILPRATMKHMMEVFAQTDIDPLRIVVESQLIHASARRLQLVLLDDYVLVSQGNGGAVALDYSALSACLKSYVEGASEVPELGELENVEPSAAAGYSCIEVLHAIEMPEQEARLDYVSTVVNELDIPVEYISQPGNILDLLARRYFKTGKQQLVDMQSGGYQSGRRMSQKWRRWRPLAWVACGWLVLEMLLMTGKGVYFQQLMDTVSENTLDLYQEYFPQDRQISDTRALRQRLMSKLKAAEQQGIGENQGEPFLPFLMTISTVTLDDENGLYVESMDYNRESGMMVVQMEADTFEVLDNYIQELKVAGLTAKVENANQGQDAVEARINIGR